MARKAKSPLGYRKELMERDVIRRKHYKKQALVNANRKEEKRVADEAKALARLGAPLTIPKVTETEPLEIPQPVKRQRGSVVVEKEDVGHVYFTRIRVKGWYDVIGPDGVPVNKRGLRLASAEELAEEKNNGGDS